MRTNKFQILDIKYRMITIALVAVYYLVFLACYYYFISPVYSYAGFQYIELPMWTWVVSISLSLIPLIWLPLDFIRPSDFAAWLLYLILILPSNVVIFMVSSRSFGETIVLPTTITACFLLFELVRQIGEFEMPRIKSPEYLFSIVLPIFIIVLSIVIFSYTDYAFNISFVDVYKRRMEAREVLEDKIFLRYLMAFLKSVCVQIAIVWGIQRRKWYLIGIAIFATIVIFSLEGSKGTIILPLATAIVVFLSSINRKKIVFLLLSLFITLIVLTFVEAAVTETNIIAGLIVRREMAIPSLLTTYYWEYFSRNQFYMMTDSIIGGFLPFGPFYNYPKTRLIGYEYFGNIEINANTNIWATAFADFGYMGMLMVSIIAALILKVFDSLGRRDKFVFASVCCAITGLGWVNGALHTSLLTNGVLGLILVLWFYPPQTSKH